MEFIEKSTKNSSNMICNSHQFLTGEQCSSRKSLTFFIAWIYFLVLCSGCNNAGSSSGGSDSSSAAGDTTAARPKDSVVMVKLTTKPCGFIYLPSFFFPAVQSDA